MKEEDKQIQNEEYNEYVKQVTPTNNLFGNMVKAFIVGGVICVIGQVILNVAMNRFGLDKETAGSGLVQYVVDLVEYYSNRI